MCHFWYYAMSEKAAPFFAKYMTPTGPVTEEAKEPEPRLDFVYLQSHLSDSQLDITQEWTTKLLMWFAHLRVDTVQNCSDNEISAASIKRCIESGELPKLREFGPFESITDTLEFFSRDVNLLFSKCELYWLFAALILVDRLPNGPVATLLERVLHRVDNALLQTQKSDETYSFLVVCHVILSKFFHRL